MNELKDRQLIYITFRSNAELVDQLQDKTDNVAVITDSEGRTLEDYYDVGNRALYHTVPHYVDRKNIQVATPFHL